MYRLYWSPGGANMAPHVALEEIGAPFELRRVDIDHGEQLGAAYLKLNPHGRVPTLIHDADSPAAGTLYESAAILLLLCERHPAAGLMPSAGAPDRGLFLQWLFYLTNTVQEELQHWWHGDHYMDSEAGRREMRQVAERRLAVMWRHLDGVLAAAGPYLLGNRYSAADIFLVMLCRWSRDTARPATAYPSLKRCIDLVAARPAWQRMMRDEGIVWAGKADPA